MKKLFAFMSLVVGLGLSSFSFAQDNIDYSGLCTWDETARPRKMEKDSWGRVRAERIVQSLEFSGATVEGVSQSYVVPVSGVNNRSVVTKIYFDKTSEAPVRVSRGDQITLLPKYYELYWMHFYLYIDYNQNGMFEPEELVSYTHFRETDPGTFYDSAGNQLSDGNVKNNGKLPVFTIPEGAKTGKTRARFKCDWNNKDACGADDLHTNRGTICDFIVEVVAPEAQTSNFTMNVDTEYGTAVLYDKATNQPVNPASVANGTELELRVAPNEGYRVSELKVGGVDKIKELKNGVLMLTAEGDQEISVRFEKKTYGIFVTRLADPGVQVVVYNAETNDPIDLMTRIEHGTQIRLFATPPTGYRFVNFAINGENKLDDLEVADEGLLITMTQDLRIMFMTEEHNIYFTYNYDGDHGTVTATLEDGSTVVESGGKVQANSVIFLKVVPKDGYELEAVTPKEFPDLNVLELLTKVDGMEDTYAIEVENTSVEFTVRFRQKQGIEDLKTLGYNVYTTQDAVVVDGVAIDTDVELYNTVGVLVAKVQANGGRVAIPADKGVYVLKIGKTVAKLAIH